MKKGIDDAGWYLCFYVSLPNNIYINRRNRGMNSRILTRGCFPTCLCYEDDTILHVLDLDVKHI